FNTVLELWRQSSVEKPEEIGIELEHEHHFDWIAFVPRKILRYLP
ncbi:hypothetical protein HRED_09075, partial [Candidatus Haloredivivus sp. G17]